VFKEVKSDDILERQSLIFIQCSITIWQLQRKPREGSDCLEDDSEVFRNSQYRRNLWEELTKVAEASVKPQSLSELS